MQITQEMLNAAMKEAVKTGIIPKQSDMDTYLKYWESMEKVLVAALTGPESGADKKDLPIGNTPDGE